MIDIKSFGFNIPNNLGNTLLEKRGIYDKNTAKKFFLSSISEIKENISLPSISLATERVIKAVNNNQIIGIFGDFDADGLTGTAIITRSIKKIGGKVITYIPDRERDGHGLSKEAVKSFHQANVQLIITVDTGSTAIEETKLAETLGIDTIITDHHVLTGNLPSAIALVNPMLDDPVKCEYSGSGVAFKLAQAIYDKLNLDFPAELLPLAAIGTIADSSPLTGENRCIVKNGLDILGNTNLVGLKNLLEISKGNKFYGKPNSEFVSFQIAPRLNAPGRIGDPEPALQILLNDNHSDSITISERLDVINQKRREYSASAWELVSKQILNQNKHIISVELPKVPLGILGPIAGRIVETTGKPAIVYQKSDGFIKASCRSNEYTDIHKCLEETSNLMIRFGGHAAAAGFSVHNEHLEIVLDAANKYVEKKPSKVTKKLNQPDAEILIKHLTPDLWKFIRSMEPYGKSNPEPIFFVKEVQITNIKTVGLDKNHLKLNLLTENSSIECIGFGLGKKPLGNSYVDITFKLSTKNWRGKIKEQIEIIDINPSN